jgi:hypothetical protein
VRVAAAIGPHKGMGNLLLYSILYKVREGVGSQRLGTHSPLFCVQYSHL